MDARIQERLQAARAELDAEGALLSRERLAACHSLFRKRFGPERLAGLAGTALLEAIHLHGSKDSLVYWLEFKNDAELPDAFGSIAGGSALKFGIYRRKENGAWMAGPPLAQTELSLDQAVAVAERHRDQLVAACSLVADMPADASDPSYAKLQEELNKAAPDISDSGWGHKYLSLIFPDGIDWFHSPDYQKFHLVRILQVPPATTGRYAPIGRFVAAADELGIPLAHLGPVLNRANGRPYSIWRIGTRVTVDGQESVSIWPSMLGTGSAAIGWDDLGDLSGVGRNREGKDWLKQRMAQVYPGTVANVSSRKAGETFDFVANIADQDLVLASDGTSVLGIGRVGGPYSFAPDGNPGGHHRRPVQWLDASEWRMPEAGEGKLTTVFQIRKPENLVAVEARLLAPVPAPEPPLASPVRPQSSVPRLEGVSGKVQSVLDRKGQAILYGPPGTGKTYWGMATARDVAALSAFGRRYGDLAEAERLAVDGGPEVPGLVRACTFHSAYGYEDFIEGYRPALSALGALSFERRDGIFRRLCCDAAADPAGRTHVLFVDEINRGDIPRIFGELITLLELDKRGTHVFLPVSAQRFTVPRNVRIVATMNTADRSVALLDAALRRRFGFVELMPDTKALGGSAVGGIPLGPWLDALNSRVREKVGRDARNLQIGHSYLLEGGKPVADVARLAAVMAEDIVPLLEEYCYEDYGALEAILGSSLVDRAAQRIRTELFEPARLDDLVAALLKPFPELGTAAPVVNAVDAAAQSSDPETDPDGAEVSL